MAILNFNDLKGHRIWAKGIQLPKWIEKPLTKYIRNEYNTQRYGRAWYQSIDTSGRECRHFIRFWRFSLITTVEIPR